MSAVRPETGPQVRGDHCLRILGVVPQRNGLSRRDGQVGNDAVGLGLWEADLRLATDQGGQPVSWGGARRRCPADSGPRLRGGPVDRHPAGPAQVLVFHVRGRWSSRSGSGRCPVPSISGERCGARTLDRPVRLMRAISRPRPAAALGRQDLAGSETRLSAAAEPPPPQPEMRFSKSQPKSARPRKY